MGAATNLVQMGRATPFLRGDRSHRWTPEEGRGGGPQASPPRCNLVGAYLGQIRAHQVASRSCCDPDCATDLPTCPG